MQTLDSFVVTPETRFAHATAECVIESPGRMYNPVLFAGEAGSGKTHLLRAIESALRPGLVVRRVTGAELAAEATALDLGADAVLVDDVAGEDVLAEIAEPLAALVRADRQVVLAARDDPSLVAAVRRWAEREGFDFGLVAHCARRAAS